MRELKIALRMTLATFLLTGIAYPLLTTGVVRILLPARSAGSWIERDGRVVGSELIGQRFVSPSYFHGRPSAAGADGYDPMASGGSNLGPTSMKLRDRVAAEAARLRAENPDAPGPIPIDLVTTSASGLDPDVSPGAARWQAPRVAAARGVPLPQVEALIESLTKRRPLGFLGEARVNVLRLNLALDRRFGQPAAGSPDSLNRGAGGG